MRSAKGSITKLGPNYFRVRVTGKAIDPNTGYPYRLSEYVRGSRKKAEAVKLRLLIEAGEEIVDSDMTYGQFIDAVYLPDKHTTTRQRTVEIVSSIFLLLYVVGLLKSSQSAVLYFQGAIVSVCTQTRLHRLMSAF